MHNRPMLKSCYTVKPLANAIYVFGESDHHVFDGYLFSAVIPMLDGQHTVDEIVEKLETVASRAEVLYVVLVLDANGFLVDGVHSFTREVAAYWQALGADCSVVAKCFRQQSVEVLDFGSPDHANELTESLLRIGVSVKKNSSFLVAVVDDYLQDGLAELNERRMSEGLPWMLFKPKGTRVWIGPIMSPPKTGCWACLQARLTRNRPLLSYVYERSGDYVYTSVAQLPPTLRLSTELAALEVAKFLVTGESAKLCGKLLTFDTIELKVNEHVLTRRPQCAMCGNPSQFSTPERPVTLSSAIRPIANGWETAQSATIRKFIHHVSPITGVVSTLEPLLQVDGAIYNYYSGPNVGRSNSCRTKSELIIRSHNGGKGSSPEQAKASALCEAIERYCWIHQGDEAFTIRTYRDFGDQAIHPYSYLNFSESQYLNRQLLNGEKHNFFSQIPEPFDETELVDWTPVWSLTRSETRYIPMACCYRDFRSERNHQFAYSDSNGLAAGNSLTEAICQGLLELIERDAVAIWWFNRLHRPAIDIASFEDPYFERVQTYYESIGRSLWLLDLTADLDVPAVAAVSARREFGDRIILGFAAHWDPRLAAETAITEASQFLSFEHGADPPRPGYVEADSEMKSWFEAATLANQGFLLPDGSVAPLKASELKFGGNQSISVWINGIVGRLSEYGIETLVLDLTRPDIQLPVVKVLAPGLRHFWRRLAPGRLYDVPVRMGWLSKAKNEFEMNPVGVFF